MTAAVPHSIGAARRSGPELSLGPRQILPHQTGRSSRADHAPVGDEARDGEERKMATWTQARGSDGPPDADRALVVAAAASVAVAAIAPVVAAAVLVTGGRDASRCRRVVVLIVVFVRLIVVREQ